MFTVGSHGRAFLALVALSLLTNAVAGQHYDDSADSSTQEGSSDSNDVCASIGCYAIIATLLVIALIAATLTCCYLRARQRKRDEKSCELNCVFAECQLPYDLTTASMTRFHAEEPPFTTWPLAVTQTTVGAPINLITPLSGVWRMTQQNGDNTVTVADNSLLFKPSERPDIARFASPSQGVDEHGTFKISEGYLNYVTRRCYARKVYEAPHPHTMVLVGYAYDEGVSVVMRGRWISASDTQSEGRWICAFTPPTKDQLVQVGVPLSCKKPRSPSIRPDATPSRGQPLPPQALPLNGDEGRDDTDVRFVSATAAAASVSVLEVDHQELVVVVPHHDEDTAAV